MGFFQHKVLIYSESFEHIECTSSGNTLSRRRCDLVSDSPGMPVLMKSLIRSCRSPSRLVKSVLISCMRSAALDRRLSSSRSAAVTVLTALPLRLSIEAALADSAACTMVARAALTKSGRVDGGDGESMRDCGRVRLATVCRLPALLAGLIP